MRDGPARGVVSLRPSSFPDQARLPVACDVAQSATLRLNFPIAGRTRKSNRQGAPRLGAVQGDTTSAMAGAMAGCYSKIPVAHIEAGIRSQNKLEPFPEEVNRKMIDVMSDLHFAPTTLDKQDLMREGFQPNTIHVTGNTCIDALRFISALPFSMQGSILQKLPLSSKRIILVTVHRRENHGAPLEGICEAIRVVARAYRDTAHLVLPVHPNPNVKVTVHGCLDGISNVTLTPPLGYRELIALAETCYFAMIDSGGLQEELPCLGKPALVLRNVTDPPRGGPGWRRATRRRRFECNRFGLHRVNGGLSPLSANGSTPGFVWRRHGWAENCCRIEVGLLRAGARRTTQHERGISRICSDMLPRHALDEKLPLRPSMTFLILGPHSKGLGSKRRRHWIHERQQAAVFLSEPKSAI